MNNYTRISLRDATLLYKTRILNILLKHPFVIVSVPYIVKVSLIYANNLRKSTDSVYKKIHE